MADRLKDATSPYLLQHAGNPVDWWSWGDAAFTEARARDVPVLLSVGYSACHWCHVMAHESFEDAPTAALMNENLVAIKVDREERPDVDAVYMAATQAMTGQGGWPMTVFMTPDREPFFCGTYFPREQFRRLVAGVGKAWREDRGNVTDQAQRIAAALAERSAPWRGVVAQSGAAGLQEVCDQAVSGLGGGFARYSVDADWVVPHFEKMLYDNALLARVYAHLWRRTGSPLARRVARETCAWMISDLGTAEGGFASALDADSGGEEGLFYTWTPAELTEALGPSDGQYAAEVFGVTESGTFEGGRSVLQLLADPADAQRLARIREILHAQRKERVAPGRDDKVVAAWNGLAIAALAETGLLLEEPRFVAAARDAASLLATVHLTEGRLARTSRDGAAGPSAGVLEDYACVAEGFLALSGVTGEHGWVDLAWELLAAVLDRFGDGAGGFYDTADDGEALVYRPADPADGPTPSGAFAAAGALLSYAALTGSARHREAAVAALGVLPPIATRFPRAAGWGLAVAEAIISGPAEIAVVGPPGDPRTAALHRTALRAAPPGAVIALGDGGPAGGDSVGEDSAGADSSGGGSAGGGSAGGASSGGGSSDGGSSDGDSSDGDSSGGGSVPLLAGRSMVKGSPAAYVCRGFTCLVPVTEPGALRQALEYPV